jgi:sulfate transport system permease protein
MASLVFDPPPIDARAPSVGWRAYFRGPLGLRTAAVSYLVVMLAGPLAALVRDALRGGWDNFRNALTLPAALAAARLTLSTAAVMTVVNAVAGTVIAYTLVRYEFRGKRLLSALVDLPFAVPGLVTGVMLVSLYGPQEVLGGWLKSHGIRVLFSPSGIVLALLFVSLPLVVRAVQPLLIGLDRDQEEAALSLGAKPWTVFWRVLLPQIMPGIAIGALLSFSRALGEFGAVVMVAGNIPLKTQTAAVYVLGEIESANQLGASAMSVVMIAVSFLLVLVVDWTQARLAERRR